MLLVRKMHNKNERRLMPYIWIGIVSGLIIGTLSYIFWKAIHTKIIVEFLLAISFCLLAAIIFYLVITAFGAIGRYTVKCIDHIFDGDK